MKRITGGGNAVSVVRLIVIAVMAVFLVVGIVSAVQTRSYIKTDARVLAMETEVDHGLENNSKSTMTKSVRCTYTYEGKTYETSYRTFFKRYAAGDTVSVYVNPEEPSAIKDPFLTESGIVAFAFLTAFVVLLSLSQRNHHEN